MKNIFIGIGSNLGNREENIQKAIEGIEQIAQVKKISSLYKNKPWGKTDQPDFINAVIEIETDTNPHDFLKKLQEIEKKLGRKKREKWCPREIDLDILFWDQEKIDTSTLKIPHPYSKERGFVVIPLQEIAPNFTPPCSVQK